MVARCDRGSPRRPRGPPARGGGWGEGGQWDQSFKYFDTAWGRVLANLEKRFAEGPIDWAPYLKGVKAYQDAEDAKAADRKP